MAGNMALPSAARATAQSCSTAAGDTPVRVHLRVHCRRPALRACAASCTALRRPPAQTTTRGRPAQVPARCSKCSQPPRALGAAHQHSECNAKFDIVLFETPWRTLLPVVFKFAHWCTFSPYRVQRKVRGYTAPVCRRSHRLPPPATACPRRSNEMLAHTACISPNAIPCAGTSMPWLPATACPRRPARDGLPVSSRTQTCPPSVNAHTERARGENALADQRATAGSADAYSCNPTPGLTATASGRTTSISEMSALVSSFRPSTERKEMAPSTTM